VTRDCKELIESLKSHEVEFLVVGSYVLAFYGRPRHTEDIDFWVKPTPDNVDRLSVALKSFGLPIRREALDDFISEDRQMIVLGAAPQAIDLLNFLGGVPFDEAWSRRQFGELEGVTAPFLSLADFVEAKRAAGRPKDLADLAILEEALGGKLPDSVE
jgi:hypothetical protein